MQYALTQVLPDVPAGGVYAGIDWATADHVACVVDMAGRVTDRFSAAHDKAGIAAMIAWLRRNKVTEVAIERGDGALVDALLAAGLTVVVITSRQVKNLRSRFGAAGAKDDRFDAFVLADTLRTDRARLRPLIPDTPATISLRMAVRARRDLVAHRVAAGNQLRAHLAVAFPAGVRLFHDLDSPISLAFLARFGSQDAAAGLDEPAIGAWLATIAVRGRPAPASVLCARLHAAPPGATGAQGAAQAGVTAALTVTLTTLSAQIKALETQIAGQLAGHPDRHIFTSLPRPGTVRAARLLAEIGDCRSRFPDPESLAGLAGVAPVTRRSGTRIAHGFRWAVNRQLRDAVLRLRRRLPARQPLGRGHLRQRPRPRQGPPARRPHHRPRLDLRHLALLARRHRLRPRQAQRPPSRPGPARRPGRRHRPQGRPLDPGRQGKRLAARLRAARPARRCGPGRIAFPDGRRGIPGGPGVGPVRREQTRGGIRTPAAMTRRGRVRPTAGCSGPGQRARHRAGTRPAGGRSARTPPGTSRAARRRPAEITAAGDARAARQAAPRRPKLSCRVTQLWPRVQCNGGRPATETLCGRAVRRRPGTIQACLSR